MQLLLKFIDLVVRAHPVVFRAESLQPLDHHTSVPRTVKNCDVTGLWQSRPEAPQIMPCLLMRLRACNRMHFIPPRIERTGDPLDVASLSGSIPSLIGDDDRNLLAVQAVVQLAKPLF